MSIPGSTPPSEPESQGVGGDWVPRQPDAGADSVPRQPNAGADSVPRQPDGFPPAETAGADSVPRQPDGFPPAETAGAAPSQEAAPSDRPYQSPPTNPYWHPGWPPPYGAQGTGGGGPSSGHQFSAPPYPPPYAAFGQSPPPVAPKRHRLRNALLLAALLVGAAGGGVAFGRDAALNSSNAATSNGGSSSGASLSPGSSSGGGFGGFGGFGGSSGPSGSSSSGGSTGVGAGGGSLNTTSIAAKVDPAIVDVNVVLGYQGAGAAGTGIVLTSNGEVLTNNHVVDGATSIRVTDVGNGNTYSARVVGTDASQDVAVIQLQNASGLATADLGNSSTLTSGEAVLALGNAGGVGGTPSTAAGSVVALHQSITATDSSGGNSEKLTGLVETNAPIEPGDSGGPLVNKSGQVLAIDTAASGSQFQSTTSQAFAIPINTALSVARQIESGQGSSTVHIGTAAMLGIEVEATGGLSGSSQPGAVIAAVLPGSPAGSAGLTAGDVIVSLDNQAINSPSALAKAMAAHHPGDRVTVGFDSASGQLHTVTLSLAAGPPA